MKKSIITKIIHEELAAALTEKAKAPIFECPRCRHTKLAETKIAGVSQCAKCGLKKMDEKTKESLKEALSHQKPTPSRDRWSEPSYDWRTQHKGNHWKTASGKWGARAQTGEVDYFDDEQKAIAFSQHSHKGQPGTYVRGQFDKPKTEDALTRHKFGYRTLGPTEEYLFSLVDKVGYDNALVYLTGRYKKVPKTSDTKETLRKYIEILQKLKKSGYLKAQGAMQKEDAVNGEATGEARAKSWINIIKNGKIKKWLESVLQWELNGRTGNSPSFEGTGLGMRRAMQFVGALKSILRNS